MTCRLFLTSEFLFHLSPITKAQIVFVTGNARLFRENCQSQRARVTSTQFKSPCNIRLCNCSPVALSGICDWSLRRMWNPAAPNEKDLFPRKDRAIRVRREKSTWKFSRRLKFLQRHARNRTSGRSRVTDVCIFAFEIAWWFMTRRRGMREASKKSRVCDQN